MATTTSIAELRKQASLPARQMGGGNVAAFFEANRSSIAAVLPKHMTPDRLMKVALHAIRTTPALQDCSTKSLFGAVVQASQLGLEPNTILGHAYLVPFKNKKTGQADVQLIAGYKGLVDLARRSGQIESIAAHAVHERDEFDFCYGLDDTLTHRPYLHGDRGSIIAFYAVAKLKGGCHAFEVMSRAEVDAVMKASQSRGQWGPWKDHYSEMGRKTAIRRLAKYLPLSIEFATLAALDGQAEAGADQSMADVIDGTFDVVTDDARYTDDAPQHVDIDTGEMSEPNATALPEDDEQYRDLHLALSECQTISDISRLVASLTKPQKGDAGIMKLIRLRQESIHATKPHEAA